MKKWMCFLIACALLLCTPVCHAQTEDGAGTKPQIVILLDRSASMEDPNNCLPDSSVTCAEQAVNWAQELRLDLAGASVSLHMSAFNGESYTVMQLNDMSRANLTTLTEDVGHIGEISFEGATNHLNALKQASDSRADGCCYVIISDGIMNYTDNPELNQNAASEFQELCRCLAEEGKNRIYLMGLGTQLEMFDALKEVEGITVRQNEDVDMVELSRELLEFLGYTLYSEESVQSASKPLTFSLDEPSEKIIINISSTSSIKSAAPEKEGEEKVELWYRADGAPVAKRERVTKIHSETTTFLYLQRPVQGEYTIKLPDGNWNCRVRRIKKAVVSGIGLTLLAGDQEAHRENGVYTVSAEDHNLTLCIKAFPEEGEKVVGVLKFVYALDEEGRSDPEIDISDLIAEQPGREWRKPLKELKPNTRYTCHVTLELRNQQVYHSAPIEIATNSFAELSLEGTAGEAISNGNPKLAEVLPPNAGDICYIWEGHEYHNGDQCEVFSVGESGAITFQKPGTYQMDLTTDGVKRAEITFQIVSPPSSASTWLDKILEAISNFFQKICDFFCGGSS